MIQGEYIRKVNYDYGYQLQPKCRAATHIMNAYTILFHTLLYHRRDNVWLCSQNWQWINVS